MKSICRAIPLLCILLATTPAAARQQADTDTGRIYIGALGFRYVERSEDALEGTTLGGGGTIGRYLSPGFSVEGEVAIPAFFSAGAARHRDISVSLLLGWRVGVGRLGDIVVLTGPAVLRSETRAISGDTTSSGIALALGFDWRFHLNDSLALVPQARSNITLGAFIFRPGIGLQWRF